MMSKFKFGAFDLPRKVTRSTETVANQPSMVSVATESFCKTYITEIVNLEFLCFEVLSLCFLNELILT